MTTTDEAIEWITIHGICLTSPGDADKLNEAIIQIIAAYEKLREHNENEYQQFGPGYWEQKDTIQQQQAEIVRLTKRKTNREHLLEVKINNLESQLEALDDEVVRLTAEIERHVEDKEKYRKLCNARAEYWEEHEDEDPRSMGWVGDDGLP